MASLIDGLTSVLENICIEYETLLGLTMQKSPVIITGDLNKLATITDEEQLIVNKIAKLDTTLQKTIQEIADVIGKDPSEIDIAVIIGFMGKKPKEQEKLATAYDKLKGVVENVGRINEHNRELLAEALEMVQFEINIVKASTQAPETANYDRKATNYGSAIGVNQKKFDTKQ